MFDDQNFTPALARFDGAEKPRRATADNDGIFLLRQDYALSRITCRKNIFITAGL